MATIKRIPIRPSTSNRLTKFTETIQYLHLKNRPKKSFSTSNLNNSYPNWAKFKDQIPSPSTRCQHFKKIKDTQSSPQKSPKVAIFHIITQQFTQKRSQTRPFNSYPNVGYQQELNQSPISTKNSSKSPEKHKKKTSKYYLQVNAITSSSKNNQKTIKKSPKIKKNPTHN